MIAMHSGCSRPVTSLVFERVVHSASIPFEDLFNQVDSIELDSSVVVAHLSAVDVSDSGKIVVTDHVSQQVILFGSKGEFESMLDVHGCNPGLSWRPQKSVFIGTSNILVITDFESFRFSTDGKCIERIVQLIPAPRSVCITQDRNIYAYYALFDSFYVKQVDYESRLTQNINVPKPRMPVFSSQFKLFQDIACSNEEIFYIYPELADARHLDQDVSGKFSYSIPEYFRTIYDGIEYSPGQLSNLATFRKIYDGGTAAISVLSIDDRTRLVQHAQVRLSDGNPDDDSIMGVGLNVVRSTANKVLTKSTIVSGLSFAVAAKHGRVYMKARPKRLSEYDVGNPGLLVFEVSLNN